VNHPPDRQSGPASRPLLAPELATAWRARAADLEEFSRGSAAAFRRCADELEASLRSAALEDLTLAEAAKQSGYSVDHLARLVRAGRIPNSGRPHTPRIRRSDLPQKVGALRTTGTDGHALSRRRIALAVAHPDSGR